MPSNYTKARIFNIRPNGMPPSSFHKLIVLVGIIIALYVTGLAMQNSGNLGMSLFRYIILVPIILFSLAFHEFSHARMADFLGDPTPRRMGRLTLNPMRHLDPIGAIMLFFTNFGWAKPVVVDPRNFRLPKRAMLTVALAGPISNLFLAFMGGLSLKFIAFFATSLSQNMLFFSMLCKASQLFIFINLSLAFFNLLPLPPLDGSRILAFFMPNKYRAQYRNFERIAPFILIILFMFGGFGPLITPFIYGSYAVLMAILAHPDLEIQRFIFHLTGGVSM